MTRFEILTLIHVGFTIIAIPAGIMAMIAAPKGSKLHRRVGLIYFYSYIGLILLSIPMSYMKFRPIFLALTLFNIYIVFSGYLNVRNKNKVNPMVTWILFSILLSGTLVYLYGGFQDIDSYQSDYGWAIVHFFFAACTLYVFVVDLRILKRVNKVKNQWLFQHMEKMLISFVTLIGTLMLRYSNLLVSQHFRWIFWILPYILFLPLVVLWIHRYKTGNIKFISTENDQLKRESSLNFNINENDCLKTLN